MTNKERGRPRKKGAILKRKSLFQSRAAAFQTAATLPLPSHGGYALVDSCFTCTRVIHSYAAVGYHLIGGLKTNRMIYPQRSRSPCDRERNFVLDVPI
ncbi:hypothetical protein BK133_17435 [Paenibacillus sp. FSL H8-0548]|nr:hypothetical protein BK133_17435 [Paenibacillus sp. FSL H8-0548]